MPSIFESNGYKVYFWSNENNEPIHIHLSQGDMTAHSTKIWLTKNGGCILAKWKEYYNVENVKFYC